jgi:hypothetical protein
MQTVWTSVDRQRLATRSFRSTSDMDVLGGAIWYQNRASLADWIFSQM